MRFSKLTQSFYPEDTYYHDLTADLVTCTTAEHDLAKARQSGETLDFVDGVLVIIPAPPQTLGEAIKEQITNINSDCQKALAAIVAPYPALEIPTWPNQYNEADAYTANSSAPTPTLTAIAAASGQTVAALATSVLAKAEAYTAASGSIVGKRQLLTAQINSAQSVAAVKLIVW